MNTLQTQVRNYGAKRAEEYDGESEYDKGNREMHLLVLKDILSYRETNAARVIELGCGTGFFTVALAAKYPRAEIVLIDGSAEMLEKAKAKTGSRPTFSYRHCLLETIEWRGLAGADIIFSALTIHHLADDQKLDLYRKIYSNLRMNGRFIYFDQFRTGNGESDLLLEYLSCKDMQRRLRGEVPEEFHIKELEIDEIIKNDRKVKADDDDREAVFTETVQALEAAGFSHVCPVYQEARFFAIVAFK